MEHNDFELSLIVIALIWILLIVSLTVSLIDLKNWDHFLFFLIFVLRILHAFLFFFWANNSGKLDNLVILSDVVFLCVLDIALILAELSWFLHLFTIVFKDSLLWCYTNFIEID